MRNGPLKTFRATETGASAESRYTAIRECRWPDARRHRNGTCTAFRQPGFCSAIKSEDLAPVTSPRLIRQPLRHRHARPPPDV